MVCRWNNSDWELTVQDPARRPAPQPPLPGPSADDVSVPMLRLSIAELTLISCFRNLPDAETRDACLDALQDYLSA